MMGSGMIVASIEPTFGMKLKMNARTAQTMGILTPVMPMKNATPIAVTHDNTVCATRQHPRAHP